MPIITKYKEQVSTVTPKTPLPRQPAISTPRVVPAAFGAGVGEAVENLGRVGEKIAQHLQRMAIDEQDKEILNIETSWRNDLQNSLTSQDDEVVMINGQEITRKKGLLMRQLGQAKGATQNLDDIQQGLRGNYLKNLSPYQFDKLMPAIDNYYSSVRNRVITHEANQLDEDFKNSTESNLKQKILDASMVRDPKQLSFAIDDALRSIAPYNSKYDEASRKILDNTATEDIVESAVLSTLVNSGNIKDAQGLLDSAKDKLAQSSYASINKKIATGYKAMKTNAERIRLENRVSDRFTYIAKIADGSLNWSNATNIIRSVAQNDPTLAEAMTKNLQKGGFEVKEDNESFLNLAQDIFKSSSSEDISDFLVRALSDTKNISKERLAILVYAARKRGEEINGSPNRGFLQTAFDVIKTMSNPASQANIFFNFIDRLKKENAQESRVVDIAKEELTKQQIKDNPNRAKYAIDQIVTNPLTGKSYKVIGYYDDGEPEVEEINASK